MVRRYQDPKQFWKDVSPHLLTEETKNNLCLGLAHVFQTQSADCVYQSASFEGTRLLGAVVVSHFNTNNNFVPTAAEPDAARLLFGEFQKSGIHIHGVVGELNTAMIYKNLFEETGRKARVIMAQGIYRCRKVKAPATAGLSFRRAELKDAARIGEWVSLFQREAVPNEPPINGLQHAEGKIKNGQIFVVEKNGKLLSMAARSRDIGTSCSVNLVFTPKESRGFGYGSAVTAGLTQLLLDEGKQETNLYTDMSNPTSNKIYQNIGYEFVCDSIHYGLD